MAVILIPNIVFAATHKDGFENLYRNKTAEVLEQTGRFASLILMCVNIPGLCAGFIFNATYMATKTNIAVQSTAYIVATLTFSP